MKQEVTFIEFIIGIVLNLISSLMILKIYLMLYEYAYNIYFKTIFLVDITNQQLLALGVLTFIMQAMISQTDFSSVEDDKSYFENIGFAIFMGIMKPLFLWLTLWIVSFFYL